MINKAPLYLNLINLTLIRQSSHLYQPNHTSPQKGNKFIRSCKLQKTEEATEEEEKNLNTKSKHFTQPSTAAIFHKEV